MQHKTHTHYPHAIVYFDLIKRKKINKQVYTYKKRAFNKEHLKSDYEIAYIDVLESMLKSGQIIKWEYETDMFYFHDINKRYLSDFKVIYKDGSVEYHEIKGKNKSKAKKKIRYMRKYFPGVKIILIDKYWFDRNGIYVEIGRF